MSPVTRFLRPALWPIFDGLPRSARRLILAVVVAAGVLSTAVALLDPHPLSLWGVLALTAGIVGGEGLRIDLPYRRAGIARFTIGDAALTAGLLVFSGTDVVVAATLGIVFWQLVERVSPAKFLLNVAQYVVGAAVAAIAVELLVPAHRILTPAAFAAVVLGMLLFLLVQTFTVAGIIALTGQSPWLDTLRRLAPLSAVLAISNTGLGLLAVLLIDSHVWAVPALGVPLVLLFSASRQEVRAQVDRERSAAFATVQQRLSQAMTPDAVCTVLAEGAQEMLGCNAAIWREGTWVTPVPPETGPCPVDPELGIPLEARGRALGPAIDGNAVAVGLGGGVLVAWSGDLRLTAQAHDWLDRLGRSARFAFDRASARIALEQERATLRAVVDGTGDGILVLDADGIVRLCNPALGRLAGISADEAVGRRADEVLGEGPWALAGVHDVMRPPAAGSGEHRTWRVVVSVVRSDEGEQLHVAAVHDVSSERRVARMKDDMLSIVSHELRTPLTPIKASAQLLRRRADRMSEAQREQLLGQIEHRAEHLARLVDDLLLVGQLSASADARPRLVPALTDLTALLRTNVAELALVRPQHHIVLDAPEALPAVTDARRIRQIVDNLVDNACKFSPPGTEVQVSLRASDAWITLKVSDSGRGIPPEDLARVFERFERVEDPLHMTTSGAGLGLYIVRALCRALGGDITVDSVLGAGTTFTVRLPLASPALPDDRARPRAGRVQDEG